MGVIRPDAGGSRIVSCMGVEKISSRRSTSTSLVVGRAYAHLHLSGWCAESDDPQPMRWVWGRHARRIMVATNDLNIIDSLSI